MSTSLRARLHRTVVAAATAVAAVTTGITATQLVGPRAALAAESTLTPVGRPAMPRPAYLSPVTDPAFGSTVTRVSDQAAFGTTYTWPRNTYSTNQAWNSDGSLMVLGYGDPGWLLDGKTYRYTGRRLSGTGRGVWSNVSPDTFYSVSGNQFLRTAVGTGTRSVRHTFGDYSSLTIGNEEGSPSNDDRTIALIASGSGGTSVVSYDPVADVVLGTKPLGSAGSRLDWAASSQSGRYIVLSWGPDGSSAGSGVELYDRNLNFVRHLSASSEHADMGYDTSGREVYVTIDYASGAAENRLHVATIGLSDGKRTTVLRTDWVGTHVSCRNIDRPGWCYMSDAVADRPSQVTGGYDEVFAVKLDGSGTVQRFAHAHQSAGISYDWQTMAVPSRDGSRVLFSNDWGMGTASPSYAYIAQQPVASQEPITTSPAPATPAAPSSVPSPSPSPSPTAVPPSPSSSTAGPSPSPSRDPEPTPVQGSTSPSPAASTSGSTVLSGRTSSKGVATLQLQTGNGPLNMTVTSVQPATLSVTVKDAAGRVLTTQRAVTPYQFTVTVPAGRQYIQVSGPRRLAFSLRMTHAAT